MSYWRKSSEEKRVLSYPEIVTGSDINNLTGRLIINRDEGNYTDLYPGRLVGLPEPAGKLRVIAVVDAWTQSLLKPLHDQLFDTLRKLPNDGTFDQDSSVKRSIEKAKASNQAYSVDLSAATDRLPIRLQEEILNLLYGKQLGSAWRKLLDRPFVLREGESISDCDHKATVIYYGTGQPMGCLSSWAMLAITHHMIVQQCARQVFQSDDWHTCYEILGDDLVIFNKEVYLKYLEVMAALDVGTNPSKSLVSDSSATFEFAKRTVLDGIDVSGLSWQQFTTAKALSLNLNLAITLGNKGLVWRDGLLIRLLELSPHIKKSKRLWSSLTSERVSLLMISLLSYFANLGKISYEVAIAYVVDPSKGGVDSVVDLPVKHTVHDLVSLFLQLSRPVDIVDNFQDLLTVPHLNDRMRIGESLVFGRLARELYVLIDDAVVKFNDDVVSVTEKTMYELLADSTLISSIPWDKREVYHYALDNLLRQLVNSLVWGHSSHDVSDELVDFNTTEGAMPTLANLIKFRDQVVGEISRLRFLEQTKSGKELYRGFTSWLASDLSRASRRIAAPAVLDDLITKEDAHNHDPFVGQWDVMMPSVKSK